MAKAKAKPKDEAPVRNCANCDRLELPNQARNSGLCRLNGGAKPVALDHWCGGWADKIAAA